LIEHENHCQNGTCENPLCNNLVNNFEQQIVNEHQAAFKFKLNGVLKVACSKKCKKVAKFAYIINKQQANDNSEILRAFESMLRKKNQKINELKSNNLRTCVTDRKIGDPMVF